MTLDPTRPSDAELVRDSRAGDDRAFATLVRRHERVVLRLCRRIVGSSADAEDLAQEAFVQAFVGLERLRDPARFGPWVHAIAANLAARARRRRVHVPLDAVPPGALVAPADRDVELAALVGEALADLPAAQRDAVLGFLAGFSYGELASRTGTAPSTIRGRLYTARRRLRSSLRPRPSDREELTLSESVVVSPSVYGTYRRSSDRVVVLHDPGGRHLGVRFTADDAAALEGALAAGDLPGASLADLALALAGGLGGRLERVSLGAIGDDERSESYYGLLTVSTATERLELRARTPDALVLAVRAGAPITVPAALWAERSRGDTMRERRAEDEAARARLARLMPGIRVEVPAAPVLPTDVQEAVERVLERLAADDAVRTAILLHASGAVQAHRGVGDSDWLRLYGVLWAEEEGARLLPPPGVGEDDLAQLVAHAVHPAAEVLGGVRFERLEAGWRLDVAVRPDGGPPERRDALEAMVEGAARELAELLESRGG